MKTMIDPMAMATEDYAKLFNPKPVGEVADHHVHRHVPVMQPNYDELKKLAEHPDYREIFKTT